MPFFKDVKNIVFLIVIFLLALALVAVSAFFAFRGSKLNNAYNSLSEELEQTKESLAAAESERDSVSAELESERNEKNRLEQENAGLKSQIEQLKAQKKEEAAAQILLQQQTPPPATKACYLTFDDGPCENTFAILDVLARYNVKATFFVNGSSRCIDYVKDISAAGHSVGLHTYSHVYEQIYANDDAYFNDLNAVSAAVEQRIGNVRLLRFPGGSSNVVSKKYCSGLMTRLTNRVTQAGYSYFDWNVDSGDAAGNGCQKIIDSVLSQASRKSGAICVLMHDIKSATTQALPYIIEGLIQQGFYFEALSTETHTFHHNIKN